MAKGKFDQLNNDIAYSAIASAFQSLAQEILMRDDADLYLWREKLNNAWGDYGRLITDLVPNFAIVAGEQPPMPPQQAEAQKHTLLEVFARFIDVFAQSSQPFILFMDDLQWADSASLELLSFLVEQEYIRHFMLICACRSDEIPPKHPSESFLKKLDGLEHAASRILVRPLTALQIQEMIEDALEGDVTDAKTLAEFVKRKTYGNAFFVTRYLMDLYDAHQLFYDSAKRSWYWRMQDIEAHAVTGSVIELMLHKIEKFPPATLRPLQFASMLGNRCDKSVLMRITGEGEQALLDALQPAILNGLLLTLPDGFCFVHDRVQEAVYASIPEQSRSHLHLHIARILYAEFDDATDQSMCFNIAQHFLKSLTHLEDEAEKISVAQHLLLAAEKAINSAAWAAALPYTVAAIDTLLPQHCWQNHFELSWRLHRHRAYCEYTTAKLESSEKNMHICLAYAKTEDQHVDIHMLYSRLLFQMNRYAESIENSRIGLAKLGVTLPNRIGKLNVLAEYVKLRRHLKKRPVTSLMDSAPLEDRHLLNVCRILYDSCESSYMIAPETMAYLGLRMANICIKHGHSIYAPFAYTLASMVMVGATKEYKLADDFIKMALALNKVYPDKGVKGRIYMCASVLIWHWNNPIHEHAAMVEIAAECSEETGNIHYAYYAIVFSRPQSLFFSGNTLKDTIVKNDNILQKLIQHQDAEAILQQAHLLHFCYWLTHAEPKADQKFFLILKTTRKRCGNPEMG